MKLYTATDTNAPIASVDYPVAPDRQPLLFATAFTTLIVISAILARLSPEWFAVAVVVAFGGPHNYAEFRYFISRLPSKLGPLRSFFLTAFSGAIALCIAEVALMLVVVNHAVTQSQARQLLMGWNELLIFWVIALYSLRYRNKAKSTMFAVAVFTTIISAANMLSPQGLTIAFTYAHPLIGLWILDRELRRTRKSWLKPYHFCLLGVPIAIVGLIVAFGGVTFHSASASSSLRELSGNNPTMVLPGVSAMLLLAVYGFLQMLHYGVYIFAMPIAARSWSRWTVANLPAVRNRAWLHVGLAALASLGLIAVAALWLGYRLNYDTTSNIYLFVATLHVLAEIPFLFWMCES